MPRPQCDPRPPPRRRPAPPSPAFAFLPALSRLTASPVPAARLRPRHARPRPRMCARKPDSKRLPYFNSVRRDADAAPYEANGNGVAPPPAAAEDESPARSLRVTVLGLRFDIPGRLLLLLVPFLWSSYGICVKWLYRLDWAFSPPLFNAIRLLLSALVVLPQAFRKRPAPTAPDSAPPPDTKAVLAAGLELGFWTILVNTLQGVGLQHTSASRGAFLGQLSTVIVPIAAFLTGMEARLGWNICIASLMALFGVGLLTLDDVASPFNWSGDGVMLSTAFLAAGYVLRSKVHAEKAKNGPLVPFKVIAQAFFALLYLAVSSAGALKGLTAASFTTFFAGATPTMIAVNVGIIVWAGLFISAGSTVLQIAGQALVSASEAVIIFSLTPLCAALLAIPLGERFGLKGIIGAGLILVSTLLASRSPDAPKKVKQ